MRTSDLELDTNLRYESKFRINYQQYYKIKNGLYPYVNRDYFTEKAPNHRYHVRSLYFDSLDYHLYYEKVGGNCDRVKFRLRTYNDDIDAEPDIRVEMKLRRGDMTEKYGAYIDVLEYQHFLETRHWENRDNPVLIEFERQIILRDLWPKLLVEYRREGYEPIDGEDTRITFDHHISSAPSCSLFPSSILWHQHHDQCVILEIKHKGNIKDWLSKVIKENGLAMVANSKFALGFESSQPEIVVPAWCDH